jgi:hypothetical protein
MVGNLDIPLASKDDYTWGYRVGQADLKQKIKQNIESIIKGR